MGNLSHLGLEFLRPDSSPNKNICHPPFCISSLYLFIYINNARTCLPVCCCCVPERRKREINIMAVGMQTAPPFCGIKKEGETGETRSNRDCSTPKEDYTHIRSLWLISPIQSTRSGSSALSLYLSSLLYDYRSRSFSFLVSFWLSFGKERIPSRH